MVETLFSLDDRNYHQLQNQFRGERSQAYYQGDCWVDDNPILNACAKRKAVGPISIIRLRTNSNIRFRRTRQHVREDSTDLSVLWFVKHGRLTFSNQCGNKVATPGDFAITRSTSPFLMECQVDHDNVHEVLHITVPTHILRAHIPHDFSTGLFMSVEIPELDIARKIFTDVFQDEDILARESASTLVETALTIIGNAVRARMGTTRARQTVAEQRLQDVLHFIQVHISDPRLSVQTLSRGCGISPRHLSFLMRRTGLTFSEMVWKQRLENARNWLISTDPRDISISEIAYGVGFKSPAHFSRMFKRAFMVKPSEFRNYKNQEQVEAMINYLPAASMRQN